MQCVRTRGGAGPEPRALESAAVRALLRTATDWWVRAAGEHRRSRCRTLRPIDLGRPEVR